VVKSADMQHAPDDFGSLLSVVRIFETGGAACQRRLWLIWFIIPSGCVLMLQTAVLDGFAFDCLPSLQI
jgi:hypothetical protein